MHWKTSYFLAHKICVWNNICRNVHFLRKMHGIQFRIWYIQDFLLMQNVSSSRCTFAVDSLNFASLDRAVNSIAIAARSIEWSRRNVLWYCKLFLFQFWTQSNVFFCLLSDTEAFRSSAKWIRQSLQGDQKSFVR